MTVRANRCRKCGRFPSVNPYEQSIDGNHDTPSSVVCMCGNSTWLNFDIYGNVKREFKENGKSVYDEQTAYLSKEFTDALTDAVVARWNKDNPCNH